MKKHISLLITTMIICLLFTNSLAATSFSDVSSNAWYKDDLGYVTNDSRKIIVGFPDGTFRPSESLTVAQLITCVVVSSNPEVRNQKDKLWYKPYVKKAIELGYVLEGEFNNYDRAITRGEMSKVLIRAIEAKEGTYNFRDIEKVKTLIKDYDKIPSNLQGYVIKAYDMGLISGFPDGTFGVSKSLIREQAVTVVRRLIDPKARKQVDLDTIQLKTTFADGVYKVNPNIPQELYSYDMSKNNYGIPPLTNKELIDKVGIDEVTNRMNIAKGYIETYYGVDYKTYNKSDYRNKLQWYFSPTGNWVSGDGVKRTINDYLNYYADMIGQKQLSIKSEFITDPSLVYSSSSTIVRGQFKFMIVSCNDMTWLSNFIGIKNVEVGKWYSSVAEVKLANVLDSLNNPIKWDHSKESVDGDYLLSQPKVVN